MSSTHQGATLRAMREVGLMPRADVLEEFVAAATVAGFRLVLGLSVSDYRARLNGAEDREVTAWLDATPEERARLAPVYEAKRRAVGHVLDIETARRRAAKAAYMRSYRAKKGSPKRWAKKTEAQREAQREHVRQWRARQEAA